MVAKSKKSVKVYRDKNGRFASRRVVAHRDAVGRFAKKENNRSMANTSETAGWAMSILQIIRERKTISLLNLSLVSLIPAIEVGRAVGWLEREGKVVVSKEKGVSMVSLSSDGVPTF